ncbi:MAG: inositol monophosphatase, partial [Chloroflexota bacterium]
MSEMTVSAVDHIINLAHQAGHIALKYFNKVTPQQKADRTFLTQADLEIEQFLSEALQRAYPTYQLIGEEGARNSNATSSLDSWVIDPIDGTTAFVQGLPGWGIAIGLLQAGRPTFGLFYMPLLDDLTYTVGQDDVYCNQRSLMSAVHSDWPQKGFLAITSTTHFDFEINVKRTRALGSVGASLVYTARGSATATFFSKASIWDLVAGGAILQRAGGTLRYLSGQPVNYTDLLEGQSIPEPIIAGHPEILDQLRAG